MKYLVILFVVIGIAACDKTRVFEKNKDIDGKSWHVDSLISFDFRIDDASSSYDVYTNICNESAYNFYNLYYKYVLKDSLSQELKSELVNADLFEPKTGKPLGNGLGDIFDHRQLILDDFVFGASGTYSISFQQYMRVDSLPNIRSIGVRVERSANP